MSFSNQKKVSAVTYTNKVVHSPTETRNQSNRQFGHKLSSVNKSSSKFSSTKGLDVPLQSVKVPTKDKGAKKSMKMLSNSIDNSPGKLMSNYRSDNDSKPAHFITSDMNRVRDDSTVTSSKTFDFTDKRNTAVDY